MQQCISCPLPTRGGQNEDLNICLQFPTFEEPLSAHEEMEDAAAFSKFIYHSNHSKPGLHFFLHIDGLAHPLTY